MKMLSRVNAHAHLWRRSAGRISEDFTESRSIVCMIDRVCFVMYRCNYELLISPYNLFHPKQTHYNPSSLLRLWAALPRPQSQQLQPIQQLGDVLLMWIHVAEPVSK